MPDNDTVARAQRALHLTANLLRASEALDRVGVPFFTFKGPTLSLRLYGDVGSRTYGDIDIMVPAHHAINARNALENLGLTASLPVSNSQLNWLTGFLNEYAMVGNGAMVEIHWSLVRPGYRFSLSYDDLALHKSTMSVAGRPIPVLKDEALLVVLAVHGSKHGWSQPSWITDFADLVESNASIRWTTVFAIARRHAATRFLLQGAWLVKHELGRDLPSALEEALQRDSLARTAGHLAVRGARAQRPSFLSYVTAMSDRRSRVRAFREIFIDPTPLDCQLVDLPESLFPLYHAVRPIRLIGKHVFKLRHRPWST